MCHVSVRVSARHLNSHIESGDQFSRKEIRLLLPTATSWFSCPAIEEMNFNLISSLRSPLCLPVCLRGTAGMLDMLNYNNYNNFSK